MNKRWAFLGTMVLTLGVGVVIGQVGLADSGSVPGSADDPIVTKSYVDAKVASGGGTTPGGGPAVPVSGIDTFKVIELKPGETLIGAEGTEIIVRSGSATAVASESGGVSDVTEGSDIAQGGRIELNHLLLTARNDGRGIKAGTAASTFVMVRGTHTVK